ncbi:MAG: alpha/beta fold hydrolase [Polyangiaceae bacterium]
MKSTFGRVARRAMASTRNVLELARLGRLGQPYHAPYEIADQGPNHRLRRYATCSLDDAPVILLVPPLMVTSEVYDLEEGSSAVTVLGHAGVQPYVLDFGAPEREQGGMRRTLDDHVVAVIDALAYLRRATGRDVHLAGYSQGGMFVYQAAALARGEGIRSLITFGSPVDIHKNLPVFHKNAVAAMVRVVEPVVSRSIEGLEGLPGVLTSTAFKVVSTRKEIEQRLDFLRKLHDRGALVRREARRRFLGGEGFVAWPGPAFREFVDQFIVHNRMLSGGFVLNGRTVTLADIEKPILAFVGAHDEMASPAAVRAIQKAAPNAPVSFVSIDGGHFGIVVGSRAMKETWPTVAEWVRHHDGLGPQAAAVLRAEAKASGEHTAKLEDEPEGAGFDVDVDLSLFVDTVTDALRDVWNRFGDVAASATDAADAVRYQEPRLRRLAQIRPETRVSAGLALTERAKEAPDETFFVWRSRAFTYREADTRVTNVVRGLWASGVRPGDRVGVVMGSRPSYLSMVTALSRLGAVAVLAPPDANASALRRGFDGARVRYLAADPQHVERCRAVFDGEILVLGGAHGERQAGARIVDMEAIDPERVAWPPSEGIDLDGGRARDLAIILLRPSESGELRQAAVTNHRWALSALGAAAACTLKPSDCVYSSIPLHHPTAILVAVGSALTGGSRLALAESFEPQQFVSEVRRYGATVAFYAGEMLRPLVHARAGRGERSLPLRLFAGSGMRLDLWVKLRERFGVGIMEFYASTTQRVIMANASGVPAGSLGRTLPGSARIEIVKVDLASGQVLRDTDGRLVRALPSEAGLLVVELDDEADARASNVIADAFRDGDRWYKTADVIRRDERDDAWFVDSLGGFVNTTAGAVSTRKVEDALYALPEIELATAFGRSASSPTELVAVYVARADIEPSRLATAVAALAPHERPTRIARVSALPLTEGFRPSKSEARRAFEALGQSSSQTSEPSRE